MHCVRQSKVRWNQAAAISALVNLCLSTAVVAADITWSLNNFNTGNLDLSGTIVQAVNFGTQTLAVTTNATTTFVTSNSLSPVNGGFQNGPSDTGGGVPTYTNVVGNTPLINVLQSQSWTSDLDVQPIALSGLFPGQSYELQAFIHDGRTTGCAPVVGGCGAAEYNLSDGNGHDSATVLRNSGSIIIGSFIANATSQTFQVVGGSTGQRWDPSLSGYVLRALTGGTVAASLNRNTGGLTITNTAATPLDMLGYTIGSNFGGLSGTNWLSVANNYDRNVAPTPGNGSIDSNNSWTILSSATSRTELSEAELSVPAGDGGAIGVGQTVNLGNVWIKSPTEDVTVQILRADGNIFSVPLTFTGNSGAAYVTGDLNFNGTLDAADWPLYIAGALTNLSALSPAERYQKGDLNNDGVNNLTDMDLFIDAYNAAHGAGAFEQMVAGVPEPGTGVLLLMGATLLAGRRFVQRASLVRVAACMALAMLMAARTASAVTLNTIATTGYDQDVVFESGLANGAVGANGEIGSRQFFEDGATSPTDDGLPRTLPAYTFTGTGDTLNFSFQPFEQNNILKFTNGTAAKSLTLATPQAYSHLAVAFTGGSLATATETALLPYTINFAGGATQTGTFNVPDWGAVATLPAGTERLFFADRTTAQATAWPITSDNNTTANRWAIYVSEIVINNPSSNITSVTFDTPMLSASGGPATALNSGDDVAVFGIAGPGISVPSALNLQVNQTTGQLLIQNPSPNPISLTGYQITSAGGSLSFSGWNSLSDQNLDPADGPDAGTIAGDGDGETWDEAGGASDSALLEGRLFGSSTIAPGGTPLNLGFAYNTTLNSQDLVFSLRNDSGVVSTGTVSYVTGAAGVLGDYNNNGVVDAADYVLWRNGGPLLNEVATVGSATAEDYTEWRARFGNTSGSGSGASSEGVPEPSSAVLTLFAVASLMLYRSKFTLRFQFARFRALSALIALSSWLAFNSTATAVGLIDRDYKFGDDPAENAANAVDGVVGTGPGNPTPGGTLDSQGPSGAFVDLVTNNTDPKYINVTTTGPGLAAARPGATANSRGIIFDGADDYLRGDRLNFPQTASGTVGAVAPATAGPLNYNNLSDRGYQLWVYPDSAGTGTLQSVVSDLNQHDVRITAAGNWELRYNNTTFNTTRPVVFNQWSHVMVVRPRGVMAPNGGGILYLNGEAVGAVAGAYNLAPTPGQFLVVGANPADANGLPTAEYFRGVLDDMNMFVMGSVLSGSTPPAGNYNFDLAADSTYFDVPFGQQVSGLTGVPGDVNQDTFVNSSDVSALVAGWMKEKRVNAVRVGDKFTIRDGDLNFDGITNLADVFQLHSALMAGSGTGFDFSLLPGGVPEPTTSSLAATLIAIWGCNSRRRRVSN
jgi:hypothetical protein